MIYAEQACRRVINGSEIERMYEENLRKEQIKRIREVKYERHASKESLECFQRKVCKSGNFSRDLRNTIKINRSFQWGGDEVRNFKK